MYRCELSNYLGALPYPIAKKTLGHFPNLLPKSEYSRLSAAWLHSHIEVDAPPQLLSLAKFKQILVFF